VTRAAPPLHNKPPSRRWWLVVAVALLAAAGCFMVGFWAHQGTGTGLVTSAPGSTRPFQGIRPAATQETEPAAVARSAPVVLRIPAIGVSTSLSTLGLNPDGTVEVPTDFQQPGWYRFGATPGQVGSAVILGHVDSYRGPAVFFKLQSLSKGDPVEVSLADGVVVQFVVTSVIMYPKDQFPAQQVYGSHGDGQLQLVTCGGQFDRTTGSYLSNIVAYTRFVAATPAPALPGVNHPNQ
jgi:hypothetical protein